MERTEPVITRTETEDGWVTTADYGKDGVTRSEVHIAPGSPEDARKNREAMNRVLARYGYRIAE